MKDIRVPAVAGVLTGLLALTACHDRAVVCSAIGWSNTVTVELAPDWPVVEGASVTVVCPSTCVWGASELDEVSEPLSGSTATVHIDMATPDSVVVTVTGPDGAELARQPADVDWRQVGGSAECGGPMAATVVVPAP
jgi:hypothetical protein